MEDKIIHIVSFDNLFPPKYGGVIDVFYKIKALHQLGILIKLHCFVDEIPSQNSDLEMYTCKTFYYKRNHNLLGFFTTTPFSILSRNHRSLLRNLVMDNFPIIFEGLQTTYLVKNNNFLGRKIFLRLHNIEENYYHGISKSESNILKKIIYYTEYHKYRWYRNSLTKFDEIFTLSSSETRYVKEHFKKGVYIPVFHGNTILNECTAFGEYAFYNGDLRISDNKRAVQFLISVFQQIPDYKLVIASSIKIRKIQEQCKKTTNISYVLLQNQQHLKELLSNSHISVMFSFQNSGTKLKVINSLFTSRFCVINSAMVDDRSIKNLCIVAENELEFINAINRLKNQPYAGYTERKSVLEVVLNDIENARKIIQTLYS
jgi:hypothetical protein